MARRRKAAPVADTGPTDFEIECARRWVGADYPDLFADYIRPFPDPEMEARAMLIARKLHEMAEAF